jgi:hypothetical protein
VYRLTNSRLRGWPLLLPPKFPRGRVKRLLWSCAMLFRPLVLPCPLPTGCVISLSLSLSLYVYTHTHTHTHTHSHTHSHTYIYSVTVLLNAQDRVGDTCLHTAVKYRRWQCAGRLMEMGACAWLLNSEGRSPIDLIKDLNDTLPKKVLIPKARAQLDKFAPPPVQAKILRSPL